MSLRRGGRWTSALTDRSCAGLPSTIPAWLFEVKHDGFRAIAFIEERPLAADFPQRLSVDRCSPPRSGADWPAAVALTFNKQTALPIDYPLGYFPPY
jgi:hypothetical protein